MRKINFANIFLFIWLAVCIVIYIYFPARVSYIYSVNILAPSLAVENLQGFLAIEHWAGLFFSLLGVWVFAFACVSLGQFISKFNRIDELVKPQTKLSTFAALATYFLIGNAIYSIIFLTLAGLYKLTFLFVLIILLIGIILGFREVIEKLKPLFVFDNNEISGLFLLNVVIFISALLFSSARISYDSSAIYFSNAKITAYSEAIQYFTEDTFVASAFQSTIQFTALIQLFGEQAARMFSWVCGLIIIIFTLALAEKLGVSQNSRGILTTLLLTSTAYIDLLGDGKVDLINSAVCIAVIYWLVIDETKKGFLLIGFLVGMSVIGRPYNVFLFGVFIFLYYLQKTILQSGLSQTSLREFIQPLLWIGLSAIPIGCFHLFANWMIQGNPLAFLDSLSNINPVSGPWDNQPEAMFVLRLLYPFASTFRNTPQSLGNISPLIIGFVPFILLSSIREKINLSQTTKILTAISIITLVLWIFLFFTVVELRYVFFLWFILFISVAQIISTALENADRVFRFTNYVLISLLAIFMIFRIFSISVITYSPLDQQKNPQCKNYILCEYLQAINESALPNERVLSLSAYRYYLRSDLFFCSTKHDEYTLLKISSHKNADLFWEEVIRQGYTYIAYENDYTLRHLQLSFIPSNDNTPSWIKLERIDKSNSELVAAYKIHLINPPNEPHFTCKENEKNILEVRLAP